VTRPSRTDRRALVTGASGFIGWHTLQPLLEHGFEVHGVSHAARPEPLDGVTWHVADLLDPPVAERLVGEVRPSHLVHLAWYVTPGKVIASPINYEWVGAGIRLLQSFAASGGRRMVVSGSGYEYQWSDEPCSEENTPLRPDTVYGACKAALSLMATSIAREAGISLAWARPFFLYGPREHRDRLVASVTLALLQGEAARTSHGRQERDYLHVQDVADAMVTILDSDVAGPVNIGSGHAVALRDIVTRIGDIVGRPDLLRIGAIEARANDIPLVVADARRLRGQVGWRPRFDLDAGLAQTVEWWRARLAEAGQA
jgi:nucleoside-diphosphate-sugar epimerase